MIQAALEKLAAEAALDLRIVVVLFLYTAHKFQNNKLIKNMLQNGMTVRISYNGM